MDFIIFIPAYILNRLVVSLLTMKMFVETYIGWILDIQEILQYHQHKVVSQYKKQICTTCVGVGITYLAPEIKSEFTTLLTSEFRNICVMSFQKFMYFFVIVVHLHSLRICLTYQNDDYFHNIKNKNKF